MLTTAPLTRRDFLKTTGSLVVTFPLAGALAACAGTAPVKDPEQLAGKTVATDQVDGFLAIDANGNVLVFSGKVDLGTGIRTAMTQIAAEELSVSLDASPSFRATRCSRRTKASPSAASPSRTAACRYARPRPRRARRSPSKAQKNWA